LVVSDIEPALLSRYYYDFIRVILRNDRSVWTHLGRDAALDLRLQIVVALLKLVLVTGLISDLDRQALGIFPFAC